MVRRPPAILALALPLLLSALAPFLLAQPQPNHSKGVWNYDGGLILMTDGSIPSGPCFRLTGHATAPGYFDNLKREDSDSGTILHRGHDIVTEYPSQLHIGFLMYDLPCDYEMKHADTRVYLTRAIVGKLRLSFYWKNGLKMRPATGIVPSHFEIRRIAPYATEFADELPEKLEWIFEFDVPSAGVPVTDSLVVVLLTPEGHIAARAAARM
jgi:hypothetical protein